MPIRIVLADDHSMLREGLRSMLEKEPDMSVVGEAANGRDAVSEVVRLKPDVVVMDVSMPGLNGMEAARQVSEKCRGTRIVALSMHTQERYVIEMLKAGASGYVVKMSATDELILAIRAVYRRETFLSPKVAGILVANRLGRGSAEGRGEAFALLTPREREVLQLLAEGKTAKKTAEILKLSASTVDVHRKNIFDKLDVESIAELTRYAIREGLVSLED